MRRPNFDLDLKIGAQSELWVSDLRDSLAKGNGEVERTHNAYNDAVKRAKELAVEHKVRWVRR